MEFYNVKSNCYEFNVVFTGRQYVFFNSWCGIAAIAERTTPSDKIGSGEESFTIKYGNNALVGGSMGYQGIVPVVKRLVNKCENKYVPMKVEYTLEECELDKYYATIEIKQY